MSDDSVNVQIAQLMCSRLCHDLVSPVGAISAALELLEDEGAGDMAAGMDSEVLGLLGRSASETSNRLAFYRAAYGSGGGPDVAIPCDELEKLSKGALGGGKITLQWLADGAESLPNATAQLLLLLALTATEALPRGGNVNVRIQQMDEGLGIACIAEGPGASLKEAVASILTGNGDPAQLSARDVTAYYAYLMASATGSEIETSSDEGAIMLAVLSPS
jgi:histidine phosphotransferase ChpT